MLYNRSSLLWLCLFSSLIHLTISQYKPECPAKGISVYIPGPGCTTYFICNEGKLVSPIFDCLPGTLFDDELLLCNFETSVKCTSTPLPTPRPSKKPTVSPTSRIEPTTPAPTFPPQTRSPSANTGIEDNLHHVRHDIDNKLLLYQTAWNDWLPSTQYRYNGFMRGLQVMYLEGINNMTFYLGEDVSGDEGTKIGLVNIAAFLAQAMKESIKYNSCDENNWDMVDGKYPLSNACGQLGQSYQDYKCPNGTEHYQCAVDMNMEMVATTHADWYGAPGPLFCGPRSKYPYTGFWDYEYECDIPWMDPPQYCSDYRGQKAGRYDHSGPVKNHAGRVDVEGCCWWGRGAIQTTGVCNYGMLNYFLGKRAADEGRPARYGSVDFCRDPGAICNRGEYPELKWIAGMFYWVSSLQPYDEDGWNYLDKLQKFVRGGMRDESFIDAVSGIVNRGCHNPPCEKGELDGGEERKENFKKALDVFFENGKPRVQPPTVKPTRMPTFVPTTSRPLPRPTNSELDEADNEEEDWSQQVEVDNEKNLWCGVTISDASNNCGRNGYNCPQGRCPTNDLKCFMIDGDSCTTGTNSPSPRPVDPIKTTTLSPSSVPTLTPTTKPTFAINESGVRAQNYCAKRKVDLKETCFTAQTCNGDEDEPCPEGTFCWGNIICTESRETPQPSMHLTETPSESPTAIKNGRCATDYPELQKTCWDASKCPCSGGKKCFENIDCNFVSPRETIDPPSKNPTTQPTMIDDGSDEMVSSIELYCAVSEKELEESCSSARSCVNESCPLGMLCIPFNCDPSKADDTAGGLDSTLQQNNNQDPALSINNSHVLCPDFFVGWHTKKDCKEYFKCNDGKLGPTYTCGEGLKFEISRSECRAEKEVNEQCYEIATPSVNEPSISRKPKCTLGYTGWDATPGCNQYYFCNNGIGQAPLNCGENLLFDLDLELCNFEDDVNCPYPIESPTPSPIISRSTPSPSQKSNNVVSESDGIGFGNYDRFPQTSAPIDPKNAALPPWLYDARVSTKNGVAVSKHFRCFLVSLLGSFHFLAYFV